MKLVVLIGNTAVGKMSVGQALMEITDLRLFHNHMMIEPVIEVFGNYEVDVVKELREVIFSHFAASQHEGMIFTYMWDFDNPSNKSYLKNLTDIFEAVKAEVFYVELIADQAIRLARNVSANRLKHKPSKRQLEASKAMLLADDEKYRCVSYEGELDFKHYYRLDNSKLSPMEAAQLIKAKFSL